MVCGMWIVIVKEFILYCINMICLNKFICMIICKVYVCINLMKVIDCNEMDRV